MAATTSEKISRQQENDLRTKELTDKLEAGIKELFSSDKYRDYLKSMSHFHNYSSRNIMLIHQQLPTATKVASYKLWNEKFNRQVIKGQKSLRIFAPIEIKPETKMFEKLDPTTNKPILDDDGKPVMEEMTELTKRNIAFKLVPVFDVSQTYGEPLPQLAENLTGNVEHYEAFLDTLKSISPLPIEFEPMDESQDGYCKYGVRIGIREGMSEIQTVSAIIHEITHARLHDKEMLAENEIPATKDIKEIEAESVSYVVCQKYGIETGDNSFGYLATWSSHDLSEVKASLDTIRNEANSLINAIDDNFKNICKERGIDLTPAEQAEQTPIATKVAEQTTEPTYTTQSTTENIAGVDFTVSEVVPVSGEKVVAMSQSEPIPDSTITPSDRDTFGYTTEDILPLKADRATELFNNDHTIFLLYPDNTEAMVFEAAEIEVHDGIFGIERDEWQNSQEYKDMEQSSLDAKQTHNPVELPEIPKSEQPVYTQKPDSNIDLAGDELKAYYASLNLNVECSRAIDQAIITSNYDQYRYDLKTAVRDVIDEFGADRVAWVLASNVNNSNYDSRFSTVNKTWAKDFDTPNPDFYLKTHLAVLNGFVDNFRKAEKERRNGGLILWTTWASLALKK